MKPREFHLYMGNLDLDTAADFVVKCVEEKGSGINILASEIVHSKRFNHTRSVAAHVVIDVKDKQKALDPSNWPEGIVIRPWRQQRNGTSKYNNNGWGTDW